MTKFNGHKNWNHWNVSLWINNDEDLYNMAIGYCRRYNKPEAAKQMMYDLYSCGITKTPDGAPYSISSIMAAMVGM